MDTISKVWTVQEVRDWLATFPADAIVTGGEGGGGDYIAVEVYGVTSGDRDGMIYTEPLDHYPGDAPIVVPIPKAPGQPRPLGHGLRKLFLTLAPHPL